MSDPTKNELNIAVIDNKVDNLTDFVKDYANKNEGITREILKTVNEHREDFVTFKVKQDTWKRVFKWNIRVMWGALAAIIGFIAWVSPIIWSTLMNRIEIKIEEGKTEIRTEIKYLINKSK